VRNDRHSLLFAGIAGATFVALVQFSTTEKLCTSHRFAIFCFCLVLPISTLFGTWPPHWKGRQLPQQVQKAIVPIGVFVVLVFCAGVVAMVISFGAPFIFPLLISVLVMLWLMHHGSKIKPPNVLAEDKRETR
jgi:hypothetical protein